MRRRRKELVVLALLFGLMVLLGAPLARATETVYELVWWTVDGGGGVSQSGDGTYTLDCTIGQPDAGPVATGGSFSLIGGYRESGVETGVVSGVFLPLVVRDF